MLTGVAIVRAKNALDVEHFERVPTDFETVEETEAFIIIKYYNEIYETRSGNQFLFYFFK